MSTIEKNQVSLIGLIIWCYSRLLPAFSLILEPIRTTRDKQPLLVQCTVSTTRKLMKTKNQLLKQTIESTRKTWKRDSTGENQCYGVTDLASVRVGDGFKLPNTVSVVIKCTQLAISFSFSSQINCVSSQPRYTAVEHWYVSSIRSPLRITPRFALKRRNSHPLSDLPSTLIVSSGMSQSIRLKSKPGGWPSAFIYAVLIVRRMQSRRRMTSSFNLLSKTASSALVNCVTYLMIGPPKTACCLPHLMCEGLDKLPSWHATRKRKTHHIYANVHHLSFAAMRICHRDQRLGPCSAIAEHFLGIRWILV